jgi:hypothetical protein
MRNNNTKNSIPTIEKLIRKEITFRIIIAILLIIIFGVFSSAYDTYNYLASIKNQMTLEVQPLENFIISQVLVSNPDAIKTNLAEFN